MTTDKNMTLIKINGNEYPLHKSILEKMSIHKVLTDCETDIMPELTWEISPANIAIALHAIHDDAHHDLSRHIEIVKFLLYLGADDDIFENYVFDTISGSVIDYLIECKNHPYDDIMLHIFDMHPNWYLIDPENISQPYNKSDRFAYEERCKILENNFATFITTIMCEHFPTNFQRKVIGHVVKQEMPCWHLYSNILWCIEWALDDLYSCFGCHIRDENLVDIIRELFVKNYWPSISEGNMIIDLLTQDIVEQLMSREDTD